MIRSVFVVGEKVIEPGVIVFSIQMDLDQSMPIQD
jgi:hypothetical protein